MAGEYDGEDDQGRQPIEGEIVGPVPLYEDHDRRRFNTGRAIDEDTVAAAVRARVLGATLRDVADRFQVSHESVRRWCGEADKSRNYADVEIATVRARIALELEALEHEAQRVVMALPGTKIALEAINTAGRLKTARATLLGAVAPTRVHVDVTEADAKDLELQEMIVESRAKAAAEIKRMNRDFGKGKS